MKKFLVILVLCHFALVSETASNTEWPVYFEHLGLIHSIHNKWDLTLSTNLHLPQLETRILKTIHRLRLLSTRTEEEAKAAFRTSEEKSRLTELQESWEKLNRQLFRRAENMRRRTRNLKSLGSYDMTKMKNPKRFKRQSEGGSGADAIIQLTGGVLQSLFGVAYTDDVRQVVQRIDAIDDSLKTDLNTVKTSQDDLTQQTKVTMKEQDKSIKMVMKMAKIVEHKVADMETNPYLKTEIGRIVRSRSELYQNLQLELNLMEERLGEVERVVISLSNGRLNKDLLPPSKLRETLKTIENQLPDNFTLLFRPNEALWPYYSLLSTVATFDPMMENVRVSVSVPLMDITNVMDLTKVHNLPLKAKDGYSVKVDITAEYLVTDNSRNHFLELHKEDFADCQVYSTGRERHFYCGLPPLLDATTTRSCVMQLYQGRSSSEWCQSKLIYGMVQPFSRLYNGSWVFSAISENVQVTLQCPDGNIPTSLMGFGIVGLAEGCTISNEEFWYPHTFAGAMELNLSFGDKGWEDSEFHTDLLEGQEDFLQFPDDEYRVDLSHVAEDDLAIIIASEPEKLRTSTARSLSTIFTDEPTTSLSSSTELENSSTLSSTEVLEPESLFSSVVTAAETSQENEVDNDDEPVVQALNVQDPENKATEIHNDILIKLREQLRKFMT